MKEKTFKAKRPKMCSGMKLKSDLYVNVSSHLLRLCVCAGNTPVLVVKLN